jgi:O-antigen ligase
MFANMIGYGVLTYLAIVLVIDYPRYDPIFAGMVLKNSLFDQMLFFLVFFYGLRTNEDALTVLKVLLIAWAVSHIFAVLDATGMFHVGDIEQRSDGRVQGAIGESNQYGAFVALSLPAIVALIFISRGFWRFFWMVASIITGAALLMTVSRGAFVGTVFAALCGMWLFRRYMPARTLGMWFAGGAITVVLVAAVVTALGFDDLIYQRVMVHSTSLDLTEQSSGRTEIWATVLEVMFRTPITLLTGFGWEAYPTFPFRWVTHNHYLQYFFNLGVIGLVCSALLLIVPVRTANEAATYASPEVRPMLIGFGIGTIAVATAVFFVNLYLPWIYYWSYAGIVMRLAANALDPAYATYATAPVASEPARRAVRDAHGWTAASVSGQGRNA